MKQERPVLKDKKCPECDSLESEIYGHIDLSNARKCLRCKKIYNKCFLDPKKLIATGLYKHREK